MILDLRSSRRMIPTTAFDNGLLWAIVLLLSFSLVMVYSASIASADATHSMQNSYYYLMRHGAYIGIGFTAGYVVYHIPLSFWQSHAAKLFLIAIILLIIVLIPGVGRVVNGARRWIPLFVLNLQPSEVMKFACVMYVSDYTVRKWAKLDSITEGFVPIMSAMVLVSALLLAEPDFGALLVISSIAMGLLFLGGMNMRIFLGLVVMAASAFIMLIVFEPYRMKRVMGFLDPFDDPYGKGYQLTHSLIAFGRGEWLGVGLGASVEKLSYLPEAHTDFIMAVIAEEFGFIGICILVGLYAWIVVRAFRISVQAKELERFYPALVAQGIGLWLGVQTFFNIGVNMGILPTKGLTLPLMSYGGSAMLFNMIALAVLIRVDWENRRLMRGYQVS